MQTVGASQLQRLKEKETVSEVARKTDKMADGQHTLRNASG